MNNDTAKAIAWFIKKSYYFLWAIVVLFFLSTALIGIETRDWLSPVYVLGILMGDSYTGLNTNTFTLSTLSIVVLVLLRFMGWLIIPIISGVIIDTGYQMIENSKWLTPIELEKRREKFALEVNEHAVETYQAIGHDDKEADQKAKDTLSKLRLHREKLKDKLRNGQN